MTAKEFFKKFKEVAPEYKWHLQDRCSKSCETSRNLHYCLRQIRTVDYLKATNTLFLRISDQNNIVRAADGLSMTDIQAKYRARLLKAVGLYPKT